MSAESLADLDRRVAVEVFGEPEPSWQYSHITEEYVNLKAWKPVKHLWDQDDRMYKWQPLPFSLDFEQAMRATLQAWETLERPRLSLQFHPEWLDGPWFASFVAPDERELGEAAGESPMQAICYLLLALAEK